jgi:hypothetical protein
VRRYLPHIILASLVIVLYADILFLGRGLFLNDVILYHYPMKHIVRDVIASGEFPYWNRFYSGGQPLAANPAYEVFYPPQWLLYFLGFHFAFQLHVLLHFILAAIGMYLLLRDLGTGSAAAIIGGAALVLCGPYISLSNKLPLLFALSWMPLALCMARRYIDGRGSLLAASVPVGTQMLLGEPTMAMATWGFIAAYVVYRRDALRVSSMRAFLLLIAAVLLAAVQLLPAIDHARDSVRSDPLEFRVVSNWSMPLARVAEFAMPALFRHVKNVDGQPAITGMYPYRNEAFLAHVYAGLPLILLAVAGFIGWRRGAGAALLLFGGAVVVAAGEHTPVFRLLFDAHIVRAIRYPEKFVTAAVFVLIVWASICLDRALSGDTKIIRNALVLALLWLPFAIVFAISGSDRAYFVTNVVCVVAVAALFFAFTRVPRNVWIVLAGIFVVGDLWWATRDIVPRMPRAYFDPPQIGLPQPSHRSRVLHDGQWASWDDESTFVFYSRTGTRHDIWWLLRNAAFPNIGAYAGHELAFEHDVDLTALRTTDQFREAFNAARLQRVPALVDPYLRILNVGHRVAYRPFTAETERRIISGSAGVLPVTVTVIPSQPRYRFVDRLVRVATIEDLRMSLAREEPTPGNVAYAAIEPFAPAKGDVLSVKETSNTIELKTRTAGRAFLALSVSGHKYWTAAVDGAPSAIVPTHVAFQGIVVPAGEHTVVFRYRNPLIVAGALISLAALFALIARARGRFAKYVI